MTSLALGLVVLLSVVMSADVEFVWVDAVVIMLALVMQWSLSGSLSLRCAMFVTAPSMSLQGLWTELRSLWTVVRVMPLRMLYLVRHRSANLVWVFGMVLRVLVMRCLRQRILMFLWCSSVVKWLRLVRVILRKGTLLNRRCFRLVGTRPSSLPLGSRR